MRITGLHSQFFRRSMLVLLVLSLMLVSACALASFFSEQDQVCELLSHFRLLWVALLFLLTILLGAFKRLDYALLGLTMFLVNAVDVVWLFTKDEGVAQSADKPNLSVLQLNVAGDKNSNFANANLLILLRNPDLIGLSEVNEKWISNFDKALPEYKFHFATDLSRSDGIAVYSKYPLLNVDVLRSALAKRPRFVGIIQKDQTKIHFSFAHPILPVIPQLRNEELEELAQDAAALVPGTAMIVFGDLNCTPWSFYFRKLLADGKLHDSERGFGPQPTFNGSWIMPLLPIDHCLVSSGIRVLNRCVGPNVGSDHLPVFVRLNY